jgi:pseudouridine-5'-phosphate glycosidase
LNASPPAPPLFHVDVLPAVAEAVAEGRPVVALESTVLTHGLPHPVNYETALELEGIVRRAGATPATIAVLDGRLMAGLASSALQRVCTDPGMKKLNRRDLAAAATLGWSGGTTVSATMALAHAVGIRVFATGGIGGVHRGDTDDVSADLEELARTPVAVVCSGAKSILDLDRTWNGWRPAGSRSPGGARTPSPRYSVRQRPARSASGWMERPRPHV